VSDSLLSVRCLDQQLGHALDLAVACGVLSDGCRTTGDGVTAVALEHLGAELTDQAAILAPLVGKDPGRAPPPALCRWTSTSGGEGGLAELGHRLDRAALVARTDAMAPGLDPTVVALLWSLATLYGSRRELLLLCTVLDGV
jgi:hypothetical protein